MITLSYPGLTKKNKLFICGENPKEEEQETDESKMDKEGKRIQGRVID